MSWGTAPVPGPTGPTGPTGPAGPTGSTGPAGVGSVAHIVTVPGDSAQTIVTGPGFSVALVCGGPFGRGIRVSVPVGSAEPVEKMRLTWDSVTDTFGSNRSPVPVGSNSEGAVGSWSDMQVANSSGGVHVTVTWTTGSAPDPCTFLASW